MNLLQGLKTGAGVLAGLSGDPSVLNNVKADQLVAELEGTPNPLADPRYAQLAQRSPEKAGILASTINVKGEQQALRAKSMARDALFVSKFLEDDNPEKAKELLRDRIKSIQALGGDPKDSMEIFTMIEAGDLDGAHEVLQYTLQAAQLDGYIPGEEFVKMTEDGRSVIKDRFGNVVIRGEKGISKNDREILKELRGNIRSNVDKIDARATVVMDNYSKIENLASQVEAGNRNSAAQLMVALVKLGDPTSVVRDSEMVAALNQPNPVAAAYGALAGAGVSEDVARSIVAMIDPLNPENINTNEVKATASQLVASTVPTIQEDFAIQREMGDSELTEKGKRSIFGERRLNKIARLSDLLRTKPDPKPDDDGWSIVDG